MQTPVEIDFQGMKGNDTLRASIINQVAALEERFGRITACRVAVKAPGEHHRKGAPYEITIHLLLPQGREVDIARTPVADERLADVTFAINDAFKRGRRRLRDQARRIRGEVKAHNGPPIATVRSIDDKAGFGFLETADGHEIYFHKNSVLNNAFSHLAPGMRVAFREEIGVKGPQASTVKLLGKHGLR
jgi:cold shock CspA family protein